MNACRLAIAMFALSLLCGFAPQERRNAANWYRMAVDDLEILSDADWAAIESYRGDPAAQPTPELRAAIERANIAMNNARRGAGQEYSDYDLDYSQGFSLELSHLSHLRTLAKVMQADAQLRIHDGDAAGAADRIDSMYTIGRHAAGDRVLISSLVGQAIFAAGDTMMDSMVERGMLDPATSATLARTLEAFDADDPFKHVEAIGIEQELTATTIENFMAEHGNVGDLFSMLTGDGNVSMLTGDGNVPAELSGATAGDVNNAITQYDAVMDEMAVAFSVDDPTEGRAALETIEAEITSGEHGLLARFFVPSLTRIYERKIAAQEQIAARLELFRGIADGSIDALHRANAARWYVAAAAALREHPDEQLNALRAFDANPSRVIDEALTSLCTSANRIDEFVAQATTMQHCDFAPLRPLDAVRPYSTPVYAGTLRDLQRFLLVDAVRHVRAGDGERAAARLLESIVLCGNLSNDPVFTSAISAHQAFRQIADVASHAHDLGVLDDGQLGKLADVADRMSRADPFRYLGAAAQPDGHLEAYYRERIPATDDADDSALQRLVAIIEKMKPDALFFTAHLIDGVRRSVSEESKLVLSSLVGLNDIVDAAAVNAIHEMASTNDMPMSDETLESLTSAEFPQPGALDEHMRMARRDMRNGMNVLKHGIDHSQRRGPGR